jgi:hypothetical protein
MDLKSILKMRKLKIDKEMRNLVGNLWKHNYETFFSCQGGNHSRAYVVFAEESGDGWFEENSKNYNLKKVEKSSCCVEQEERDFREFIEHQRLNPCSKAKYIPPKFCRKCGAGLNGLTAYGRVL